MRIMHVHYCFNFSVLLLLCKKLAELNSREFINYSKLDLIYLMHAAYRLNLSSMPGVGNSTTKGGDRVGGVLPGPEPRA